MTRKVIVDRFPPEFQNKVTKFNDPAGIKYILSLEIPKDVQTFLSYYNNEYYKETGNSVVYFKSPWIFAGSNTENKC